MTDKNVSPGIFYHGSAVVGIKTLLPYSKAHNTIKNPVVYLTPNETLSLFYIWNRPYKFVTFNENDLGTVVYTEWYDNQFSDLIKGLSGSIYECVDDKCIYSTHIAGVYNSDVPVNVSKETVIDNTVEYFRVLGIYIPEVAVSEDGKVKKLEPISYKERLQKLM